MPLIIRARFLFISIILLSRSCESGWSAENVASQPKYVKINDMQKGQRTPSKKETKITTTAAATHKGKTHGNIKRYENLCCTTFVYILFTVCFFCVSLFPPLSGDNDRNAKLIFQKNRKKQQKKTNNINQSSDKRNRSRNKK